MVGELPIYIPKEADSATKFHFWNNLQWFRTVQSGFTVYVVTPVMSHITALKWQIQKNNSPVTVIRRNRILVSSYLSFR